jgi:fibronectin type 3 domain-containing protein
VSVTDAMTDFLTGSGQITATIDNVGTVAKSGSTSSYVPFYGAPCSTNCPAAPANLEAYAVASKQVNLTWTASSTPGALYSVYRSTTSGFTPSTANQVATSVTGTSFADTTAVAGTPYYYVVEASDVAGLSSASNQASATTTANHGEQITSYNVSIDSGCLNAAACTNASYNTIPTTSGQNWVYDTATYLSGTTTLSVKSVAINNPTGIVNWVPNNVFNSYTHGGPFTYTIPGLTPGASYIVALDFNENFVQTGTGYTNGGKVGYREFNVAINGAAVLSNFDIYATTGGANIANVQSFYTFADANGKISILFTIGAANNPTVNGIQVGTGSNMPAALAAPTNLAASSASDTQANISWDASSTSGVVYEVFRSTISGFTPSASNLITTTSGTSYADASLMPLTTYYYQVEANDGLFTSLPSNQASVSTPVGSAASIAEIGGSGQTAQYGAEFTNPLTVIVQDAYGNLVPDASVTFTGTGVSFPSGNTAVTNSLGQAQITAQPSAIGALAVTASVTGASAPASFTETGTPMPAALITPAPGSVLAGSSVTFTWSPGYGPTSYQLWLGTTGVGSKNLYNSGSTTGTTETVSGLPTDGVTLYARLWSLFDGKWQSNDYTYTEAGTLVPAALTTPTPGSVLPGSTVTFAWPGGAGPATYQLWLGTTGVGSKNLYNSGSTTGTTETVTGLPTDGVTLYARLWSLIDGKWQSNDYTYTESGTPVAPVLTTPAPGSVLSGSSVAFTWTAGAGPAAYQLWLGTTGVGSKNLYNSGSTTGTTETVTGLPTYGLKLYARLYWEINAVWKSADYTYTEAGTPVLAALTSPTPGTVLSGSSVAFAWSAGDGPTEYQLDLGTTGVGSSNLYNSGGTTATTETVSGLPTGGVTVFARLYSLISGKWQSNDYTYTEAGTLVPAALTTPTPGSTLAGSTVTFAWTGGNGPAEYQLELGTTGVGSSNLYNSGGTTATTETVSGLPTTGVKVYVRLYQMINGVWQSTDYTYTAQ